MLNMYRVISLSLFMSLFFAAPLLCVHPISTQQKRADALATKRQQTKRVTAAWQRTSRTPYVTPADRLAGSLREAEFVHVQGEEWNEDGGEDWHGVGGIAGSGGVRTLSHSSIYH